MKKAVSFVLCLYLFAIGAIAIRATASGVSPASQNLTSVAMFPSDMNESSAGFTIRIAPDWELSNPISTGVRFVKKGTDIRTAGARMDIVSAFDVDGSSIAGWKKLLKLKMNGKFFNSHPFGAAYWECLYISF